MYKNTANKFGEVEYFDEEGNHWKRQIEGLGFFVFYKFENGNWEYKSSINMNKYNGKNIQFVHDLGLNAQACEES